MECEELEHVQYKFASIIGGLCGKPKVLSQFAVWLDIRLAEYKLKGAISLDCSGVKPDPTWLDGLKPDKLPAPEQPSLLHVHVPDNISSGEISQYSSDHLQAERETAYINTSDPSSNIVIKSEYPEMVNNTASVYPVSLHCHGLQSENARQQDSNRPRVHPTEDVSTRQRMNPRRKSTDRNYQSSTGKVRKVSPTPLKADLSECEIIPVNESLMSLIRSSTDDVAVMDNDYEDSQPQSANNSPTCVTAGEVHGESNSTSGQSIAVMVWSANQTTADHHNSTVTNDQSINVEEDFTTTEIHQQSDAPSAGLSKIIDSNDSRRSRIKNIHLKPIKSVRNVVAAVANFERWFWWRCHREGEVSECRPIFAIPPEELDHYLAMFFKETQKPHGGQFHPDSFRSLRSRLESYLKDNDYPVSLIHADVFSQSRAAFRQRLVELKALTNFDRLNRDSLSQELA